MTFHYFWFGLWCFCWGLLALVMLPFWLLYLFCSRQDKDDHETL